MTKLDEHIVDLAMKLEQLKVWKARLGARKRTLASRQAQKDDTWGEILAGP